MAELQRDKDRFQKRQHLEEQARLLPAITTPCASTPCSCSSLPCHLCCLLSAPDDLAPL